MKTTRIFVALLIAAIPLVSAQTPDAKQGPGAAAKPAESGVEQTLMKMERDALAALL
jgi:hypothetical protein